MLSKGTGRATKPSAATFCWWPSPGIRVAIVASALILMLAASFFYSHAQLRTPRRRLVHGVGLVHAVPGFARPYAWVRQLRALVSVRCDAGVGVATVSRLRNIRLANVLFTQTRAISR